MSDTRDLGFIKWTDEYGALEKEGPLLTAAVADEDKRIENYKNSLKTRVVWAALFKALPTSYPPYYDYKWNDKTIYVSEHNRYLPNYTIKVVNGSTLNLSAVLSIGTTKSLLWSVEDRSEGAEKLSLTLYNSKLEEAATFKDVGDSVASHKESIYYLGAEETLWFNSLNVINNLRSKRLYKEKNPKFLLTIVQPKHQDDVFLLRRSALHQDLAIIKNDRLEWLVRGYGRKLPITRNIIAYNSHLKIGRDSVKYPAHHYILSGYKKGEEIFCSFTNAEKQAVLKYSLKTKRWSSVIPLFVGEVSIAGGIDAFTVGYPNRPDVVIDEEKAVIFRGTGPQYDLESGTEPVPWFAVHPKQKPRGIVIIGYGSYGMMTKKYQVRLWQPWLARGYMIATLCVRGGGEVGDEWWEAGRGPANLHNRVDDFVAGVKALQSRYSFDRTNTVIYGRSAGGFLVTAASYHLMDKIGAVYAAKPYTDLLRTTTNAEAGQTLQESDEFGYVEDDPVGFRHNFEISPYENAPESPKINPGVLVTGGTNDSEVPLSHPVRYSKRLNKIGWKNVFCRVEQGEGHFTALSGESAEADDAAIIESFLEQSR